MVLFLIFIILCYTLALNKELIYYRNLNIYIIFYFVIYISVPTNTVVNCIHTYYTFYFHIHH